MMKLEVAFRMTENRIDVGFCHGRKSIGVEFQNFQKVSVNNKDVDYYNGNYTVVPKTQEQTLATRKKYLTEDVIVKEIPFFEVSNEEGGATVYIGKEL